MLKLGIVGGGIYGTHLLKAYTQFQQEGLCQLTALAELHEGVLKTHCERFNVKGYQDYKEMFAKEELDGVAIATPDFLHGEIAIAAADAGLNIFLQKPMDVSVEGCYRILEAVERNGVFLEVDFHKRFDPSHIQLANAVRQGKMGSIEYGYCWVEDTIEIPTEWLKSWSSQSSPAWFIGIHVYDLMRWIINSEPVRVYASGVKKKLPSIGFDTYDSIQAKVEFEQDISITFDSSWVIPKEFPAVLNQGLRLVGTEGIWEIDGQNRGVELVLSCDKRLLTPNNYFIREDTDFRGAKLSGYGIDSMRAFVLHLYHLKNGGSITDLGGHYASGFDGLQATKIAIAIHESADSGKIVNIK